MRVARNNLCIHRTRPSLVSTPLARVSGRAFSSPVVANKDQEKGDSRARQSPPIPPIIDMPASVETIRGEIIQVQISETGSLRIRKPSKLADKPDTHSARLIAPVVSTGTSLPSI